MHLFQVGVSLHSFCTLYGGSLLPGGVYGRNCFLCPAAAGRFAWSLSGSLRVFEQAIAGAAAGSFCGFSSAVVHQPSTVWQAISGTRRATAPGRVEGSFYLSGCFWPLLSGYFNTVDCAVWRRVSRFSSRVWARVSRSVSIPLYP